MLYDVWSGSNELRSLWLVEQETSWSPRALTRDYPFDWGMYGGKWSFDGRHIAFRTTAREANTADVIVVEVDTGQIVMRHEGWGYAWAPTDSRLAVLGASVLGLYVLNVETGEEQSFPDVKTTNPSLAWAPSGEQIALVSSTADTRIDEINILTIRNGGYHTFTHQPGLFSKYIWIFSWSPDGKHILSHGHAHGEGEQMPGVVSVLDVSTGVERELVEGAVAAVWSPDGQEIAYIPSVGGPNPAQVYRINIETGEVTQLTDNPHPFKESLSWR